MTGLELEWPLDLDLPRDELGGLTLRQLADIPYREISRFKGTAGMPAAKGELSFWAETDPLWQAIRVWALMQTDIAAGSIETHLIGSADLLYMSTLRFWCEQPAVLVTATFHQPWSAAGATDTDWHATLLASDLTSTLLNGQHGNSIVAGDLFDGPEPAPGHDPLQARLQGADGFAPTPMPGQVAALAEQASAPQPGVIRQPHLVVNRRLTVWEGDGWISAGERARTAAAASINTSLSHRIAARRATIPPT